MHTLRELAWMGLLAFLAGCGLGTGADADLLVSGELRYVKEPHTYEGDFVFTADTHAVVRLLYVFAEDAPSEEVAVQRIGSLQSFPVRYRLRGDPDQAFSRDGRYLLDAEVFSGAGDENYVGDLVSEYQTEVSGSTKGKKIVVTGLEHCDSPNAGGYCTTLERP